MSILAIEPGFKDNVDSWAAVFSELKQRGLKTGSVKIGIMDGLPGLENLFKETFPFAVTAELTLDYNRQPCYTAGKGVLYELY